MEKIIFFGLAIPILAYVLYLGGTAIMKGFSAKEANRVEKEEFENCVEGSWDHLGVLLARLGPILGRISPPPWGASGRSFLDVFGTSQPRS